MSIELEAGKYYKNRLGEVCGPLVKMSAFADYDYEDSDYRTYMKSGSYYATGGIHNCDLVEEVDKVCQSVSSVDTKPPIGLPPINIFLELQNKQRVQYILDACLRYNEANMNIPQEWIDELSSRLGETKTEHFTIPTGVTINLPEEFPKYLRDFEPDGGTYSPVEDTTHDGCDECHFHRRPGCGSINDDFQAFTGFKCHSAPTRIHFVKKQ